MWTLWFIKSTRACCYLSKIFSLPSKLTIVRATRTPYSIHCSCTGRLENEFLKKSKILNIVIAPINQRFLNFKETN